MLDFLFANGSVQGLSLLAALRAVAVDPGRPSHSWSGPWGCLVVAGRAYPGFDPVETEGHLIVALGGPVPRHELSDPRWSTGDKGTRWMLAKWKDEQRLRWEDDLVGHFAVVCITKATGQVEAITDINSFVPLYATTPKDSSKALLVGSHSDALALAAGRLSDADTVSVTGFFANGTVTYPYTLYDQVRQLPPAARHVMDREGVASFAYWTPEEKEPPGTFRDCALTMRETLENNVRRMCAGASRIGVLFSAGEDSRVIASLARKVAPTEGITLADSRNREVRIAERVAERLGIRWSLVLRSPTHYLDRLASSVCLTEYQRQYLDAHAVGLLDDWPKEWPVLGGYLADVFLKGHHIPQRRRGGTTVRIHDHPTWQIGQPGWPHTEEVDERRKAHRDALRQYRPQSAHEWARLWPASHLNSLSHLAANRRSHVHYEPFIDAAVTRLSARIPQAWKVNRRFFHAVVEPWLKDTRGIPHPSGFFPGYGLAVNAPLIAFERLQNRVSMFASRWQQHPPAHQGPWPPYDRLGKSDAFHDLVAALSAEAVGTVPPWWMQILADPRDNEPLWRFRVLQMLAWKVWRRRSGPMPQATED